MNRHPNGECAPSARRHRLQRICLAILWGACAVAIVLLWFNRISNGVEFVANLLATYVLLWFCLILASRRTPGDWATRFVAVSASLCLAVAAVETAVFLRVIDFRVLLGVTTDEPWRNPSNRLDPELLHVRQPNLHLVGEQKGGDIAFYYRIPEPKTYRFDVQYDANGFRNRSLPNQVQVAVLGDSFIEAFAVSDDDLITTRLAKLLQGPVANLGQIWYGPQQHLAVLKRYALPLKPKVCVWCLFEGNDLSDIDRYDEVAADWPRLQRRLESTFERSLVRNGLLAAVERFGKPAQRPDGAQILGTSTLPSGAKRQLYFYYPGRKLDKADAPRLARLVEVLKAGYQLCKAADIRLIIAVVPTKFRVHGKQFEFKPESPCRHWERTDFPDRVHAILASIGPTIGFVDLGPPLEAKAKQGEILYFEDDTHWSGAGHSAAAHALAEAIGSMLK